MDIIQFISAAGFGGIIGGLVTTLLQAWLSQKSYIDNRTFGEKKDAYIGFINAYRAACIRSGKEEQKEFAYWAIRSELVGNSKITECIEKMKTANFDEQEKSFKMAVGFIKEDLGFKK